MKRSLVFVLCCIMILALLSCGSKEKLPYDVATTVLDATDMSKEEYNDYKIEQFENRFTKFDMKDSVIRLVHYRSKTEYAMLIEFVNEEAAQNIYNFVLDSTDAAIKGNVLVYGDCDKIKDIF